MRGGAHCRQDCARVQVPRRHAANIEALCMDVCRYVRVLCV